LQAAAGAKPSTGFNKKKTEAKPDGR